MKTSQRTRATDRASCTASPILRAAASIVLPCRRRQHHCPPPHLGIGPALTRVSPTASARERARRRYARSPLPTWSRGRRRRERAARHRGSRAAIGGWHTASRGPPPNRSTAGRAARTSFVARSPSARATGAQSSRPKRGSAYRQPCPGRGHFCSRDINRPPVSPLLLRSSLERWHFWLARDRPKPACRPSRAAPR